MERRFVLLWLEGPLQAWGADSKFGRRDSLKFPTKSAILGLVCCALGARGEQRALLAEFSSLAQTVVSYAKAQREPLLRDFQMVGSGYDDSDPWSTLHIPKKSDGGKAVGGGTKMTYRFYLQDARFAVMLEIPPARDQEIIEALQNPFYELYLGRKTCAPTDLIYRGIYSTEEDALRGAQEIAVTKELKEDFRVVEGEHEGEVMTLHDVPIQFGDAKKYSDRRVTVLS